MRSLPPVTDEQILRAHREMRCSCSVEEALADGPVRRVLEGATRRRPNTLPTPRAIGYDIKRRASGDFD
jgi:hypothetical protein